MSQASDMFDDAVFAGEYVLGVLSADDRARAESRALTDENFAALIQDWEHRLAPLALEIGSQTPPAALKRRVMKALFTEATEKQSSPLAAALSFWRMAAAALAAIALFSSSALLYFTMQPDKRFETQLIATVLPADAAPVLFAEIDETLRFLDIENAAIALTDDQAAELWLIPEDGTPRSLGIINATGRDRIEIPQNLSALLSAGAALAVSLEPLGGSPTGAPTGPVIGVGRLSEI